MPPCPKNSGAHRETFPDLEQTYASHLVHQLAQKGFRLSRGGLTVILAHPSGFCPGVARALRMAYETRRDFPAKRIFLTNEIIHNPFVNRQLAAMGFHFLAGGFAGSLTFDDIHPDDIVILPAFGSPLGLIGRIKNKGARIVDTACGAVIRVWKKVEEYRKDGFTSIIHGNYSHEETIATASRARGDSDESSPGPSALPKGHYLIIRDLAEAGEVSAFLEGQGSPENFLKRWAPSLSEGFDPQTHLERIGLANQTTMLSSESLSIQEKLRASFVKKYGLAGASVRFRAFDTICPATQDRQDAVKNLMANPLDLMIVLGGYNSSNTGHLAQIGRAQGLPTFHIQDASCLEDPRRIRHQPAGAKGEVSQEDWWPAKTPLTIGLAAGASTPNNLIGEVALRIFQLHGSPITEE